MCYTRNLWRSWTKRRQTTHTSIQLKQCRDLDYPWWPVRYRTPDGGINDTRPVVKMVSQYCLKVRRLVITEPRILASFLNLGKLFWILAIYSKSWLVILNLGKLFWILANYSESWLVILNLRKLFWILASYSKSWQVILNLGKLF